MTPVYPANPDTVTHAVAALKAGQLVALPTETVYGLAALAKHDMAVAQVFAAKGRPQFNPLIVHVTDAAQAASLAARWTPTAQALADRFWPGPLTLVLPRRVDAPVAPLACAGLDTIALRAPAHPITQAIIAQAGPLVMPSANPSGRLSPTRAVDVARGFAQSPSHTVSADDRPPHIACILDAGATNHGVESTVIGLPDERTATLLRAGPVSTDTITAITGPLTQPNDTPNAPASPGRTLSHYAPARAQLRINAQTPGPGEAYIGFGPCPWCVINLSPTGDVVEAAANIFTALRAMDDAGFPQIAVAPIPNHGLGLAINDRLSRAQTLHNL